MKGVCLWKISNSYVSYPVNINFSINQNDREKKSPRTDFAQVLSKNDKELSTHRTYIKNTAYNRVIKIFVCLIEPQW